MKRLILCIALLLAASAPAAIAQTDQPDRASAQGDRIRVVGSFAGLSCLQRMAEVFNKGAESGRVVVSGSRNDQALRNFRDGRSDVMIFSGRLSDRETVNGQKRIFWLQTNFKPQRPLRESERARSAHVARAQPESG